jgi:hypothetical protein
MKSRDYYHCKNKHIKHSGIFVYLDGKKVEDCIEASAEEGTVSKLRRGDKNTLVVGKGGRIIDSLKGKVDILVAETSDEIREMKKGKDMPTGKRKYKKFSNAPVASKASLKERVKADTSKTDPKSEEEAEAIIDANTISGPEDEETKADPPHRFGTFK